MCRFSVRLRPVGEIPHGRIWPDWGIYDVFFTNMD